MDTIIHDAGKEIVNAVTTQIQVVCAVFMGLEFHFY